jgi:hypothetical protein
MDAIANFFWSRKAYERVFKPARADLIHEWQEAIWAGENGKARWIPDDFTAARDALAGQNTAN